MMKRAQFNFVWIFAIIVGASILFLAIYGALKTGDVEKFRGDTEIAKSISILTDPLQAGFAEGSFGRISFNEDTRLRNVCFGVGFGKNDLSVSTKSRRDGTFGESGGAISIHNKYIFSDEDVLGRDFYVFSKPFEFPYKVSDMIFLTSKNYCFIDAPEWVVGEVSGLNMPNVELDNCTLSEQTRVCFGSGSSCDVRVVGTCVSKCDSAYDEGVVRKNGGELTYSGNLMYAAIFSEKNIYNCNVERLLYRTGKIAEEFTSKIDLMDVRGCDSNLKADLFVWKGFVSNSSSTDLIYLNPLSKELGEKNRRELCGIW